jgi:hypothetical protein
VTGADSKRTPRHGVDGDGADSKRTPRRGVDGDEDGICGGEVSLRCQGSAMGVTGANSNHTLQRGVDEDGASPEETGTSRFTDADANGLTLGNVGVGRGSAGTKKCISIHTMNESDDATYRAH